MPLSTPDVRQSLLAHDPEFRRLAEEHSRCESQLEQILKDTYRNAEDLIQETYLKKLKLRLKDEMELMVARHQHQSVH
ncbi:MAG TPA: hypothetical protein VKS44_10095 [Candidatus Acidoferrales bacterium]|jgi:uncharacterized protein YdcH (DUF465 family)|nr:hypothetical protein [Candidatus Acidoferrales bacterium]